MALTTIIPILGLPYTLHSIHPIALISCACDAHAPLLLGLNIPTLCPACRTAFILRAYDGTATGPSHATIDVARPTPGESL